MRKLLKIYEIKTLMNKRKIEFPEKYFKFIKVKTKGEPS